METNLQALENMSITPHVFLQRCSECVPEMTESRSRGTPLLLFNPPGRGRFKSPSIPQSFVTLQTDVITFVRAGIIVKQF